MPSSRLLLGFACSITRTTSYERIFPFLAVLIPITVIVDFLHPGVFYPLGTEGTVPGRAAATFINPNKAGEAMLLTFLLAIPVLRPRYRALLLFLVGAGVILTFSRGAILGWMLLWLYLAAKERSAQIHACGPFAGARRFSPCCWAASRAISRGVKTFLRVSTIFWPDWSFFRTESWMTAVRWKERRSWKQAWTYSWRNPSSAQVPGQRMCGRYSQHTQPARHARCRVRCLRDSAMGVVSRDPMEGKILSGEGVSANCGYRIHLPVDVYA